MFPHGFTMPGLASLVYLAYLFLYFPWAALRSARRIRAAGTSGGALPSRTRIWIGSLVAQALLFLLAWIVGSGWGFKPFAWDSPKAMHVAYAVAALALSFAMRAARRAVRTDEERRGMFVHAIAPRTSGEVAFSAATVLAASIAEEVAYRGAAMSILWYATGNPWLAAALCAVAFAIAHAVQGRRSMGMIFGVALVMHALVWLTGSLVPAMIVHALYDFGAGWAIRREAMKGEAAPAS